MLSNSNTVYSKGLIKMEEHTVPSVGYSPQHGYENLPPPPKYPSTYGQAQMNIDDGIGYGNLAESFDLSLLGDNYDDHDMATVPSPGSWIQATGAHEPAYWQQMSMYAMSPANDGYGDYSLDMKPILSPPESYEGNRNLDNNGSNGGSETIRNLLLRQCLEDTTFQKKCNFKPLDIPIGKDLNSTFANNNNGVGSNNLELTQIEPVFSLAFQEIRADIKNTCATLDISADPCDWSAGDVQTWLAHTLSSLPRMMMNSDGVLGGFWGIDGQSLLSLSEDDFKSRDPGTGEKLFANLDLWKMSVLLEGDMDMIFSASPSPPSPPSSVDGLPDLLLPGVRVPEDSSGSSVGYSDSSDTCSSVDSRSPRPLFNPHSELMHTDDDEEDEEVEEKVRVNVKKGPGGKSGGAHIHLWQFLKELLASPTQNGSCIRWLDQSRGVFKIEDSVRVARLWGLRKNRPAMNYDKLSRSIRQYYRKGIMRKTERSQRLVYQFCHPYGL